MSRAVRYSRTRQPPSELRETVDAVSSVLKDLPPADNAAGAVDKMLRANAILRNVPWPPPFDETNHRLHKGDARDLSFIENQSVHLYAYKGRIEILSEAIYAERKQQSAASAEADQETLEGAGLL